jgi:tRNA (guanine37-N1)-methyltransferase
VRIDLVTIFPDYFAPLGLSLVGKARQAGLLDVRVHNLRDFTTDRHSTVDDAPYGGGAGMVMKPDPWGRALDALVGHADPGPAPALVVPTPAGRPLTQELAEELATQPWLVFACGRYEGIDHRVVEHAATRMPVQEVSLGDYVLNGGEVAALAVVEAVVRLLPGFLGNAASLAEESHATGDGAGLLEAPVYTRPPVWRGLEVPDVLLGGHHGQVARWRREQALARTARVRPDLVDVSALVSADVLERLRQLDLDETSDAQPGAEVTRHAARDIEVRPARLADAGEIWTLQRACWLQEAWLNETLDMPPLTETLDDVRRALGSWRTYVVLAGGRLVGSVRGRVEGEQWEVGRIMVAPDLQGRGLGRWLLELGERMAPPETRELAVFTGARSKHNIAMYRKAGYRPLREQSLPGVVRLVRRRG